METISRILLTFLLNASWQIALVEAIALVCSWLLRDTAARYRHALWVAALVISCSLCVFTSASSISSALSNRTGNATSSVKPPLAMEERDSAGEIQTVVRQETSKVPANVKSARSVVQINNKLAIGLIVLYLLFVLYRSFRLLTAWRRTRTIAKSVSTVELSEQLQAITARCQKVIGVKKVRIVCSQMVAVPVTIGWLNPLVVLPEYLLKEADDDVLTSALGHELVHVARRDYLLNLIYELIYLPLSFHPGAALFRRRINQSRELGCDELVTEKLLDPKVYARSLVQLAGSVVPVSQSFTTMTVGIDDADILEERVAIMLKRPRVAPGNKRLLLIITSLLLMVPCVAAAPFALRINLSKPENPGKKQPVESTERDEIKRAIDESEQANQFVLSQSDSVPETHQVVSVRRSEREALPVNHGDAHSQPDPTIAYSFVPNGIGSQTEDAERAEAKKKQERMLMERQRGFAESSRELSPEQIERQRKEIREAMARRQALAKQAKITMGQAVRIAADQQPGTVTECSLVAERDQVFYRILIISGDEANSKITRLLVNAVDGSIVSTGRE